MKKIILAATFWASLLSANNIYDITGAVGMVVPEGNTDLENQLTGGLRLGKYFDYKWLSKVEAGFESTKTHYEDMGVGKSDRQAIITRYFVHGIKEFGLSEKINLYALLGFGWENIHRKARYGNNDAWYGNYGLGLRYKLTDSFSLRAEARHAIKTDNGDGDNNLFLTLAFSYAFTVGSVSQEPEQRYVVPVGDTEPKNAAVTTPAPAPVAQTPAATPAPLPEPTKETAAAPAAATPAPAPAAVNNDKNDDDKDGVLNDVDVCPSTPAGKKVDEVGCTRIVKLEVKFGFNRTDITNKTKAKLVEVAQMLKNEKDYRVIVIGHADSTGPAEYNLELSRKRAIVVATELMKGGVDKGRLSVDWFGETQPAASNDTPEGRAQNRRVEGSFLQ